MLNSIYVLIYTLFRRQECALPQNFQVNAVYDRLAELLHDGLADHDRVLAVKLFLVKIAHDREISSGAVLIGIRDRIN